MSTTDKRDRESHRQRARLRPRPGGRRQRAGHLRRARPDPVPTGAERLPAHRPRQGDHARLRHRRRVRWHVQPALRRHQPRHRRDELRRGIIEDLAWLGFEPGEPLYASDYFEQLYEWAEPPDRRGKAYVDDQDGETISEQRGGYGKPGIESPLPQPAVEENLDLFRRMRAGEFEDGSRVLRAKIDMQHENMQLRDPVMYRIRHEHHHRTGDAWMIYPDLRLGPRAERRDRGDHALAVHARVRQPPGAVRLVPRAAAAAVRGAAPDRVRPAGTHPHGHVQAQADQARPRRHRRRVGRPAHADVARAAPPRLPGVGDPRVLQLHRRRPHEQPARRSSCSSRSCAPS